MADSFFEKKQDVMQRILTRSYGNYWVSQEEWEGYEFNDLMIKPRNENEIGFFITEVRVSFTVDRNKMSQDIVPIHYSTLKGQIDGSNDTYFFKYNINDDINNVWSNDGVWIQASHYLFDPQSPLKYSIQNAFDGNPATSYVENTEDDLMKVSFRKINIREDLEIKFSIINGYSSNVFWYESNNRIKKCGLANGENTPFLVELNNMNLSYQIKTIKRNDSAYMGLFEFVVNELYLGKKYNDSCIAELNFWDNSKKEWLFGEIDE